MVRHSYRYVQQVKSRGMIYNYYRRDKQSIPLPNEVGTLDFAQAYERIHASFEDHAETFIRPGTVEAVITEYKESSDFTQRADETRRGYRMHLDAIQQEFGKDFIKNISRRVVLVYRESLSHKPATANYRLAVLRRVLSFAVDRGYITVNNALRPKKFKVGTHNPWTPEQLSAFRIEDSGLLAAFWLAIYTGQRKGDILRMTWDDVQNGKIKVVQQKTGKSLLIPMHPRLKSFLDRLKEAQELSPAEFRLKHKMAQTIVSRPDGMPYGIDNFGHRFKEKTNALGITGVVFHGLRKNSTNFLLLAGCTPSEVGSINGMSRQMVDHYSAGIDQASMAEKAMAKLETSLKL
jgi:integrase